MKEHESFGGSNEAMCELEQHDARKAAFHEAGHVAGMLVEGIPFAYVEMYSNPNADPLNTKLVGARVVDFPTIENSPIMALAGICAEEMFECETDENDILEMFSYEPEMMSDTDWRWSGFERADRESPEFANALRKTVRMLKDNWRRVEAIAQFMEEGYTAGGIQRIRLFEAIAEVWNAQECQEQIP